MNLKSSTNDKNSSEEKIEQTSSSTTETKTKAVENKSKHYEGTGPVMSRPQQLWDKCFNHLSLFKPLHKTQHREESNDDFFSAVSSGDLKQVEKFIREGVDVNQVDEEKTTALHLASDRGFVAIVKILLDNGAIPTAKVWFDKSKFR